VYRVIVMRIKQQQDPELSGAFEHYRNAKVDADQAISRLEDAEAKLLKVLEAKQRKTVTDKRDGLVFSATYTQRSTTQINEAGLRKALGARVFDKYTIKKLDRKAMEKAMEEGVVDPTTVAQYVEQVPGKTFLTYRVKEETDEA